MNTIYRLPKKLDTVIKCGKDVLTSDCTTNVVYKINCNNCSASYIGQTKRHLNTRVKEHCNNIKLHHTSHSVVSKHRSGFDHNFDWNNYNILHTEIHVRKREIAEMFLLKN